MGFYDWQKKKAAYRVGNEAALLKTILAELKIS